MGMQPCRGGRYFSAHQVLAVGMDAAKGELLITKPPGHVNKTNCHKNSISERCSLFAIAMSIDLSLNRLQRAIQHLPRYTRPTCHIAGTNGKGSVTAIISSILRSTSPPLNVGRYNSPHLVTVTDCIVINDRSVEIGLYNSVRAEIERIDTEHGTKLTNFELLTLTALQVFERVGVDIAIVEVGMGGRLDATNIIPDDAILISALTNVDLDHQAFLGDTISAIATEKVGIARPGKPFVMGPQKHPEVVEVVKTALLDRGSELVPLVPLRQVGNSAPSRLSLSPSCFRPPSGNKISFSLSPFPEEITTDFPLHGDHQLENLATALTAISILINKRPPNVNFADLLTPAAIADGICRVQWPGRLSFHTISSPKPLPVLVDGAHNAASAKTLANYITQIISLSTDSVVDITYILALSHSPQKPPLEILSPLLPPVLDDELKKQVRVHVALLRFSPPVGMPWVKAVPPSELADVVENLIPGANVWVAAGDSDPMQSLSAAVKWAADHTEDAGIIVVAGSLYLVADFYRTYR